MNVIKVDEALCSQCKACYRACWIDVIRWDDERDRPVIAYPEDCVDCNYCEISCPDDAIKVSVDTSRPWPNTYR